MDATTAAGTTTAAIAIMYTKPRETTKLLTSHLPISLALLIESWLGVLRHSAPITQRDYTEIITGGHIELTEMGVHSDNQKALLFGAALINNICLLARAIRLRPADVEHLNSAIIAASAHGADNEIFSMLVAAGGNPNQGMVHAAASGNIRIIEHLAELGAQNYDTALGNAMGGMHLRAMQWAFNRGASHWNYAIQCAAGAGNRLMVIVCLHNGGDIEAGLRAACGMGHAAHMRVARFLVGRGAVDFNGALAEACEGGSFAAINYLIDCGASECSSCREPIETHRDKYPDD
jgi:hypothetical protein